MSDFLAVTFDGADDAEAALRSIRGLEHADKVGLEDTAVVRKDDGRVLEPDLVRVLEPADRAQCRLAIIGASNVTARNSDMMDYLPSCCSRGLGRRIPADCGHGARCRTPSGARGTARARRRSKI